MVNTDKTSSVSDRAGLISPIDSVTLFKSTHYSHERLFWLFWLFLTVAVQDGWQKAPSPQRSRPIPRKALRSARPLTQSRGASGRPPELQRWARRRSWPTPPSERGANACEKHQTLMFLGPGGGVRGARLPRLWADCCRTAPLWLDWPKIYSVRSHSFYKRRNKH